VIGAFRQLDANILVQEFIKESKGSDVRAFVIGGKVAAAMMRTAPAGEFRSNLHRGGTAEVVKLSPMERATAVKAAKAMGLNVAGVDIIRSNHGPLVLEVNSSPGLEGIETATGIDVAGRIIEFIEKTAKPGRTRDRVRG
jgi:ribosomal protein S6--L-glutamate ligase